MPSALAVPRWRFTQHALDRMAERDVSRDLAVSVLEQPTITYGDREPQVSIAVRDDIRVVYDTTTSEVITVARQDQELEPPMSGWINLDAKQAEKLLTDWGFEIRSTKATTNLWGHPYDDEKRLVPFSIPGRGSKANGKGSFRTAAQIVGVNVNVFQQGPTDADRERLRLLKQVDEIDTLQQAPDPLGIRDRVVLQRTNQLYEETMVFKKQQEQANEPATWEEEVQTRSRAVSAERLEAALVAITGEALTSSEVAHLLECSPTTAKQALNTLLGQGRAVRRLAQTWELTTPGRPGFLYMAGDHRTEIPPRYQSEPEPVTAPSPLEGYSSVEDPTFVQPDITLPEEPTVKIVPTDATPEAEKPKEKLFTATGTPWPTGGILIQDEDGAYYVARKLVEEGR